MEDNKRKKVDSANGVREGKRPVRKRDVAVGDKRPVKRTVAPEEKRQRPTRTSGEVKKNTRPQPKKKKRKKTTGFGMLFILLIIILLIGVGVYGVSKYTSSDMSTGDEVREITVDIPEGTTVFGIANLLRENAVIDSATHFKTMCKLQGVGSDFKAGSYVFTNNMTFEDIVELLEAGATPANSKRLTVKEGQWLSEIADEVESLGICTKEEFMRAANSDFYNYDFIKDIPQRDNFLEGYLYPNTYFIGENMAAEDVVDMMLREFDNKITENDIIAKAEKAGHTLDEIVTIASLIEAEVKYEPERVLVSSVIHNRLKSNTKLQIDASVLYALGERRKRVFENDLKIEEPHNTYYVEGLPIGPINSPRIESLIAACEPEDTNYLFYVVEDTETGQHAFCENYEDFLVAKEKYLAKVN